MAPMTERELYEKFVELTGVYEPERQQALWQKLGDVTQLSSVQQVFEI